VPHNLWELVFNFLGIRQLVWKLTLKLWLASRKSLYLCAMDKEKSAVAPVHPQKTCQSSAPYWTNRNHEMKF
jgi:hypothetical protein